MVAGKESFGLFFDYPARILFDIGYTRMDTLTVTCAKADLDLYVITGEGPYDVVRQFRKLIGPSYIPPKFAFGFGQSRWGYKTRKDFTDVVDGYRDNKLPWICCIWTSTICRITRISPSTGKNFPISRPLSRR